MATLKVWDPTTSTYKLVAGGQSQATADTRYVVRVLHGSTASTARPANAGVVYWVGSVYPDNSQDQDIWYDTSEGSPVVVSGVIAADHLYFTAKELHNPSGSPTLGAAVTQGHLTWLLDATTAERVSSVVPEVPNHWTTYDVDLWWANASTGSGDVVWRYDWQNVGAGDTLVTPTTGNNVTATAGAEDVVVITTIATGITAPADGKALSFSVLRNAASGSDTLANDAGVFLVHLRRAS